MKYISILGSTGSIGKQTLEVVRSLSGYKILGLACNSNIELLETQIREFRPKLVNVYDSDKAKILKDNIRDLDIKIYSGDEGLINICQNNQNNLIVVSLVGLNGLLPMLEAIKNKINIALATKEILVAAGQLVMNTAKIYGVDIIPIDSEHCAIKQCLSNDYKQKVSKIILTASGGPFRGKDLSILENVSVCDALRHPNWSMGRKITIDSATLMNKGLEIIEARWLFDIEPAKIDVIIHPQSIIHSMVEYIDGTIIAQLAIKDMKIPIQYAITYPQILPNNFVKLNLVNETLSFEKPDMQTFKSLRLAYEALNMGGTMPTVLNSANEYAVELFLDSRISFLDIQEVVEKCMKNHINVQNPNINQILESHFWARDEINDMIN